MTWFDHFRNQKKEPLRIELIWGGAMAIMICKMLMNLRTFVLALKSITFEHDQWSIIRTSNYLCIDFGLLLPTSSNFGCDHADEKKTVNSSQNREF